MIDGTKLRNSNADIANQLTNNSLLDWNKNENIRSKNIFLRTAKYQGLTFSIYKGSQVEIAGSLHKYYNDGVHNADDFTRSKLASAIKRLESEFGINPNKWSIHNLEFGVNLKTDFEPNDFLDSMLCYSWKGFNDMDIDGKGQGKECWPSSQYGIKIYNKGLQYHMLENILRIEKRVVTMKALNWDPIMLSDLLNPDLWLHFNNELKKMFNTILINDFIYTKNLSRSELRIYNYVTNKINWKIAGPDKRKRLKSAFNDIICKHGSRQFKPIILNLIDEKCVELMEYNRHNLIL